MLNSFDFLILVNCFIFLIAITIFWMKNNDNLRLHQMWNVFNRRNNFFISLEFNKCSTSSKLLYVFFFISFVSHHNSKTKQKFDIFFFIEQNEISKQSFFLYLNVSETCFFTMFAEFTFSMFTFCKSRWLMNVEEKKSFDNSFSMFDMRSSSSISLLNCEAFHSVSFEKTWWVEVRLRRFWWAEERLRNSWWAEKKLRNSWWVEEILKNSWWAEQILKNSSWTKVRLKSSSWIKKRLNNASWAKVRFEVSRLIEVRFETFWWINRLFFEKIFCLLNTSITTSFHTSHWTYVCCLKTDFFFDSKNMFMNIIHYEII
jgi:hypothetical protein